MRASVKRIELGAGSTRLIREEIMRHKHFRRLILALTALVAATTQVGRAEQPSSVGEVVVKDILTRWSKRQSQYRNAKWTYAGTTMIPKGRYSSDPNFRSELPENAAGDIPVADHESALQIELTLDFVSNRVRRKYSTDIFDVSEARFVPDVEVDLFDGKEFQNYAPRDENTSSDSAPSKYQPDVTLGGQEVPGMFFRPVDLPVLMFHGLCPTAEAPLTPSRLQSSLPPADFKYVSETTVDGDRVVILEAGLSKSDVTAKTEIWVNMERDALPVYIINTKGSRAIETSRYEITHEQLPGGWRPAAWTLRWFTLEGKTEGVRKVLVTRVEYNQDLSSQLFSTEIRPGMVVSDRRSNQWYVKGKVGESDVSVETLKARSGNQLH
jgi:hypothetical protein